MNGPFAVETHLRGGTRIVFALLQIAKLKREGLSHTSGQVFDIDYSGLPPAESEALRFVLNDLGWAGYLGFVEEGADNLHIGCSPTSRDFFASVFQEALGKKGDESIAQN